MKIKYLRLIDRYFGFLLNLILAVFKRLFKAAVPPDTQGARKILIIKFWGFGSIILAYDFFQVIRKKFPNAHICALTLKQNRPAFEMAGLFDEIVDIDIKNLAQFGIDAVWIISRLRKKSFDISFELEFTSRFSAAVSYLINAKKRIGFQYNGIWRGDCFTEALHFREDVKLKDSYLNMSGLVRKDIDVSPQPLTLNIGNEQKIIIDNLLKAESLDNVSPVVGFNINASELCLLRRWPKEYFVSLAKELIKLYSAHIIFIGSKDDFSYVESAIGLMRHGRNANIHNFSGRVSLTGLAYLMTKFNLFISNDSGPLHLAAYLKIPTISFFGPETPLIYGPEGKSDTVFYKRLACSPCIRVQNYKHGKCINNHSCLKQITPSFVLEEIKKRNLL